MFCDPDGPPPPERLDFLVNDLWDYLQHSGLRTRWLTRIALFVLVWLAPLMTLRPPLGSLPVRERVEELGRIEHTSLGLVLLLLKTLFCIIYYEHPDAERELVGDAGGCLRVVP